MSPDTTARGGGAARGATGGPARGAGGQRIATLDAESAKLVAEQCDIPSYMATLSIFQVLLKNQVIAKPFFDLLGALLFKGELDVRLRELVIMRTGWVTGSVYEWTQHWKIAQSLGVEPTDLIAVKEWRSAPLGSFSAAEKAALAGVDDVAEFGEITAQTYAEIRASQPDESHVIELVVLISSYAMVSTTLRSLDVPLEEGVDPWPPAGVDPWPPGGADPWPPEGERPVGTGSKAQSATGNPDDGA